MKYMSTALAPLALGLFLAGGQEAKAACVLQSGDFQETTSQAAYDVGSGAFIDLLARSSTSKCSTDRTDLAPSLYFFTGKPSVSNLVDAYELGTDGIPIIGNAQAQSSLSDFRVSTSVNAHHSLGTTLAKGQAMAIDLLYFKYPSYSGDVDIDFTFCSTYESVSDSVNWYTTLAETDMALFFPSVDGTWSFDDSSGSSSINHTYDGNGKTCHSGELTLEGTSQELSVSLSTYTRGTAEVIYVEDNTNTSQPVQTREGRISSTFRIGSLPSGVTCYSSSGLFPGCGNPPASDGAIVEDVVADKNEDSRDDGSPPREKVAHCSGGQETPIGVNYLEDKVSTSVGNPINFALGYKYQNDMDYSGGLLSFNRIYRSDSTWTSGVMGSHWRHNFDRVLNIVSSPLNVHVDLIDGSGVRTIFREDGSGGWEAADVDIVSTFENDMDGATHIGYVYTTKSDMREYYDLDGLLTRIEYRGGELLSFTHDGSDRLSTVSNEHSQSLSFSYTSGDQVASVITPTGTFTYGYDSNDNLTSVTKPDSEIITYHYEDTSFVNALTGITDELGIRYATYGYNSEGLAISSKHAGDVGEYTFAYGSDDRTTVTNPLGKETIYSFETINGVRKVIDVEGVASTSGLCPASGKSYTYDVRGFMETKTDWLGRVTRYAHNDDGLVTSITQAEGESTERVIGATYVSGDARLVDVISESGRTTDYDYDSDDRLSSVSVTDIANSETRTTSYTYYANTTDSNGNTVLGKLYTINGARTDVTDVTTLAYDSAGLLDSITNAAGHVLDVYARDSADRVTEYLDQNGIKTKIEYDALGRIEKVTEANNRSSYKGATIYAYNDDGALYKVTLANGVYTKYFYDNAGRLIKINNSDSGEYYTLDDAGNRTETKRKKIAPSSDVTYRLYQTYDELSRIFSTRLENNTVSYGYDVNSNVTQVIDKLTHSTDYSYDGLDRVTSVQDRMGETTSYDLNVLDQLEGVTDARDNETSYVYNAFGDVTQEISRDRGTTTYSHDDAGNVTSMTTARGITVNYSYDALNRLTLIDYPSDSDVVLAYDFSSGCGDGLGRLCSVTQGSNVTTYVYSPTGDLESVTETRGSLSYVTQYSYDTAHYLSSITYPSGRVASYSYNLNGEVTDVSMIMGASSTTLADNMSYLAFGGVESMDYGNGLTVSNTYDDAYRLETRDVGSVMSDIYEYDSKDNVRFKNSDRNDFDLNDRLIKEVPVGSNVTEYSLDEIGNRTLLNPPAGSNITYLYENGTGAQSNRLTSVGGVSVIYDSDGNITGDGTSTYVWDDAGRMSNMIKGATSASYSYDSQNLRTSKTVGSVTTHYVYGAGGQLFGEYDASGTMLVEYVYLDGNPLVQIDAGTSEVLTYLHSDHIGTPRIGTDSTGTQVWAWSSAGNAYGQNAPTGTATVNLRFAGQYFDGESDLHYNWNRYYDPATGRYISSDPIGLDGGLNTFAYADANPIMFTDPEGLQYYTPEKRKERAKEIELKSDNAGRAVGGAYGRIFCVFVIEKSMKTLCRTGISLPIQMLNREKFKTLKWKIENGTRCNDDLKNCMIDITSFYPLVDDLKACRYPPWPADVPAQPEIYDDIRQRGGVGNSH